MPKILVLDDEVAIRGFIRINLRRNQLEVVEAGSGEEALALMASEGDCDIALLDVMLPGIDGVEVCRVLRELYPQLGIIMLTARGMVADRVSGLVAGADDYIVKPFSPAELVARVNSLLRRTSARVPGMASAGAATSSVIESGPFTLCPERRQLRKNGITVPLTPTEFSLLELFVTNCGAALSRNEILDRIWGQTYVGDPKVVDVNIRRLRQKIEDDSATPQYLVSVRGYGYRWEGATEA